MKIVVSSDWHGLSPSKEDIKLLEDCNLLLLAGDVFEEKNFSWKDPLVSCLKSLTDNGTRIIMIPGNHDFHIYNWAISYNGSPFSHLQYLKPRRFSYGVFQIPYSKDQIRELTGVEVLIDEEVTVDGIRIYGTPWCPEFCGWAFMLPENDLPRYYSKIPENLDILLAHSPPNINGERIDCVVGKNTHCGSTSLAQAILDKSPKYFFCGHIHTGSHTPFKFGSTICENVSYLDENYQKAYPFRFLEVEDGKLRG